MERRSFLLGIVGALAMPAIVRPGILMPVRKLFVPPIFWTTPGIIRIFTMEDYLSDVIHNIDPEDTPFFSFIS